MFHVKHWLRARIMCCVRNRAHTCYSLRSPLVV